MAKKHTGTAGPLGLFAFGVTTTLMMLAGLYPVPGGVMLPLAFVFGGIVQLIAGIIELYREDVFHGTVFASYGCFWIAVANGSGSIIYFCGWGVLTFGFWIISLRKNIGSVLLFTSLVPAFFLIASGEGTHPPQPDVLNAGRWTAFVTGCIAIYLGFGTLIHESYKILLPGMAPMPEWFPICCWARAQRKPKVRSIWGLRFTPSEQAYYGGSPRPSLGSYPGTPVPPPPVVGGP
jgi:succinate-acetate transporter protein